MSDHAGRKRSAAHPSSSDPETGPARAGPGPSSPKLAYLPKKLRIQVTITADQCRSATAPPSDLVTRARDKMHALHEEGAVQFYVVYENRLAEAWRKLRAESGAVTLTLAAGAPALPGLTLKPGDGVRSIGLLTIAASVEEVAGWDLDWLRLHLGRQLKRLGAKGHLDPSEAHAALLRAQAGKKVVDLPLSAYKTPTPREDRPFHLALNRARGEVSVTLFEIDPSFATVVPEQRIARLERALAKLGGAGRFRATRRHLAQTLQEAALGRERIGLGLPLTMLAAIDIDHVVGASTGAPAAGARGAPAPGGTLSVVVSPDRSIASVIGAELKPGFHPTRDWVLAELTRAGVVHGVLDDAISALCEALKEGRALDKTVIAHASAPRAGEGPKLVVTAGAKAGDLRGYRGGALARAGETIAEIRYDTPAEVGRDVTGGEVPPPPGPGLSVICGEGVVEKAPGRYVAEFDGIVTAEAETITLTKMLVHQGNLNNATGDLAFDGPVEITGDIDSGVKVRVGGDLTVKGEIRGGTIICHGNLVVERGIVLGSGGTLNVRGDVKADFIENATILCGGTVQAARSIIQSRIAAAKSIETKNNDGRIVAGSYTSGALVKAGFLGNSDGPWTEVTVGASFKAELAISIRQARVEKLKAQAETDRKTLREIVRKPAAKHSKTEKAEKERITARLPRWAPIVALAEKRLEEALASRSYDSTARIQVSDTLSANCRLKIAGKVVPLSSNLKLIEVFLDANGVVEFRSL